MNRLAKAPKVNEKPMFLNHPRILLVAITALTVLVGCNVAKKSTHVKDCNRYDYHAIASRIEYPDA